MDAKAGFRTRKTRSGEIKYPWKTKKCLHCNKRLTTNNPNKVFCKVSCRVAHWQNLNKLTYEKLTK